MRRTMRSWSLLVCSLGVVLAGCQSNDGASRPEPTDDGPPVVEVQAVEYAFVAPDTVPSGWVTFRLNTGQATEVHDLVLRRLPEGRYEDISEEVYPAQDSIVKLVQAGEVSGPEEYRALQKKLYPKWVFNEVTTITDKGRLSPGRSARKTVHLEPGVHMMECFVKAPDGNIHAMKGMVRRFVVSEDSTGASPPSPDVEVAVSGDSIVAPNTVSTGTLTVAARLGEFPSQNTIHLVQIPDTITREEVARWQNFMRPEGVIPPAPAEYLGGYGVLSPKPREHPAYFTVENLRPGRYHWVVSSFDGTGPTIFESVVVE